MGLTGTFLFEFFHLATFHFSYLCLPLLFLLLAAFNTKAHIVRAALEAAPFQVKQVIIW